MTPPSSPWRKRARISAGWTEHQRPTAETPRRLNPISPAEPAFGFSLRLVLVKSDKEISGDGKNKIK